MRKAGRLFIEPGQRATAVSHTPALKRENEHTEAGFRHKCGDLISLTMIIIKEKRILLHFRVWERNTAASVGLMQIFAFSGI